MDGGGGGAASVSRDRIFSKSGCSDAEQEQQTESHEFLTSLSGWRPAPRIGGQGHRNRRCHKKGRKPDRNSEFRKVHTHYYHSFRELRALWQTHHRFLELVNLKTQESSRYQTLVRILCKKIWPNLRWNQYLEWIANQHKGEILNRKLEWYLMEKIASFLFSVYKSKT